MNVNKRGRIVLLGVLHDGRRLADMDARRLETLPRQQRGQQRLRIAQAQVGLVPMNLAGWLQREPTNSERVLFHREYLRLEDLGLIERCNLHGGRRTTHLRLTEAGRRLARALLLGDGEDEQSEAGTDEALIDLDTIEFMPIELPV